MDTQDVRLAVLYRLISDLNDAGKIQLQKLTYFLQESFSVPSKYRFKMYLYGPYSEALDTDISRLHLSGYVNIQSDPQGYGFHITPVPEVPVDAQDTVNKWTDITNEFSNEITTMIQYFGCQQASELELAATIHFVKNLLTARATHDNPPTEEQIVKTVKGLKPKFSTDDIFQSYFELQRRRLD